MNNQIIQFIKDNYDIQIRYVIEDKVIWYVAADILKLFGYKNVSKTINSKAYNIKKYKIPSNGGRQVHLCIDYPSLVKLVLTSKKEELDKLQKWLIYKMSSNYSI